MTVKLYPYQQKDLEFFSNWGRSANFSEPGVGKTPIAIKLIEHLNAFPCLIVCPASVKYHWENEIRKFTNKTINIVQYKGQKDYRIKIYRFDIIIVNYELFRQDFELFFKKWKFKMTIFDEAHRLKNHNAQVTKCAYKLNTEFIHLMTGTPITNQFDDMYSYLHLLFPSQFKNYWQFVHKYGIVSHNGFGKEILGLRPDKAENLAKIIREFSIRRTKKEVLPNLPDKIYQTISVDLKPRQRQLYDELKDFMIAELENNETIEVPNIISQMAKLRQITLSTGLVGDEQSVSTKKEALLELLQDRKLAGKKTVVMTSFRKWVDELEETLSKKGFRLVRITGKEKDKEREKGIQNFQNENAEVALCTIKAAGVGIDLTAADMLIFTDLEWADTDNKQAEDRIHRASQTKGVQIVKLQARNTIDQRILDTNLLKRLTAAKLLDDHSKEKLKEFLG